MEDEYEYEYNDGDSDSSSSGDELEDLYENAKSLKSEGNIDEAVAEFTKIAEKDTKKGEQGFRALKQLFKVAKAQNKLDYAVVLYDQLLAYATDPSGSVPRNKIDKAIGNIMDRLTDGSAHRFAEQILSKTADAFRPLPEQEAAKHERLWFLATKKRVEVRLNAEHMSVSEFGQVGTWLEALHSRMRDESGADRLDKASRLWEVYALRMRLTCRRSDHKQLELLVGRVLQLTCNVSHPETVAFVRECTAYVQFRKSRYTQAYFEFVDAFNHYEQAGCAGRIKCLSYMVLLSVLTNTPVAPLTLATTQALAEEPLVREASQLVEAYVRGAIRALLATYEASEEPLRSDTFVKEVIHAIVLHTLTSRMPSEIWKDILQALTRDDIESSETVGRRWRDIANKLAAPSRHISYVALHPPAPELVVPQADERNPFEVAHPLSLRFVASDAMENCLTLSRRLADGPRLCLEGTSTDFADLLSRATRHAFIDYFYICQPLEEELLLALPPQLFKDIKVQTVVYDVQLRKKKGGEDGEMFKKFFLAFGQTPNLIVTESVTFMTDAFLAACTARGVAEVRLRDISMVPFSPVLSKDAIFDFCFGAGDRGRTRVFTVHLGEFGADFMERAILDSENPSTTDPVLLSWSVVLQSPNSEERLACLRRHAAKRVPCDGPADSPDGHELYRWTTNPQRFHIMTYIQHGAMRTYVIARGTVELPRFSGCTCVGRELADPSS